MNGGSGGDVKAHSNCSATEEMWEHILHTFILVYSVYSDIHTWVYRNTCVIIYHVLVPTFDDVIYGLGVSCHGAVTCLRNTSLTLNMYNSGVWWWFVNRVLYVSLTFTLNHRVYCITQHQSIRSEMWVKSRPLHRNVFLFECRPQKDVNILMVPTVERFCLIVTHRKSNCFSVTHKKKNLFQGYPQNYFKVTVLPTKKLHLCSCCPQKIFAFLIHDRRSELFQCTAKGGFLENLLTEE